MIKVDVRGIERLGRMLASTARQIDKDLNGNVKKGCAYLSGEVKQSIAGHRAEGPFIIKTRRGKTNEGPGSVPNSVDTGRMLNSVNYGMIRTKTGRVYSNLKYSPYIEYGTTKIKERRHFRNSLARNRNKIKKIIETGVVGSIRKRMRK